ncbi:MAG: signal recognition particle-docking protein FtsY [Deltaproteobacteria bacterium]|nr:signal recognition particle-docking protein FtsY [Deltaproteobacteria bacterium]
MLSLDLNTVAILVIALVLGSALAFIGVLIQWSLRKARPSQAEPSLPEARAALVQRSEEALYQEALEGTLAPEQAAPPISERPTSLDEVPAPAEVEEREPAPKAPVRIGIGLRKTRENFLARIRAAITGSKKTEELYEGLEEALIAADVGVEASLKIVEAVRIRLGNDSRPEVVRDALKAEIARILEAATRAPADSGDAPLVIMMVGVNGVGKTTTVAKLAARLKAERGGVIVAAADTFRAAAIEQLQVWCDRAGVDMVKQSQGSDPAAVAFDAVKAAVARNARSVVIDTAGRLQTKVNLMEELKKIARVAGRELPGAPHETWLVLDANTGQNALSQAKIFGDTVPLTGVVLAKLDSTAKGGVVIAIADRLKVPVRFVGLGEEIDDLREFDAREFVDALFEGGQGEGDNASGSYAA